MRLLLGHHLLLLEWRLDVYSDRLLHLTFASGLVVPLADDYRLRWRDIAHSAFHWSLSLDFLHNDVKVILSALR